MEFSSTLYGHVRLCMFRGVPAAGSGFRGGCGCMGKRPNTGVGALGGGLVRDQPTAKARSQSSTVQLLPPHQPLAAATASADYQNMRSTQCDAIGCPRAHLNVPSLHFV